ncbi:hypothetical protein [Trueperella sp.]|uniref:hypothetical protein n=1 Tax=Trueperella sp. TaxID=2699835 RepID=UPI0037370307
MSRHTELTGTVRSMTYPGAQRPQVRVRLEVGDATIALVFMSRSTIECIDIGSTLTVSGALTTDRGTPTMFNPRFVVKGSHG